MTPIDLSTKPGQPQSWDITDLPTTVRGIWLYLYLVIDVWSRKVVVWDVAEREDPAIAADLVSRACLRERISKRRRQPLILHADNGNAMRAATLESRLEELGVLRSFSRPRVSNDNPYSESLFRTAKYRPDYPRKPFTSKDEACQWVASFVDWYNHRHRHSGIKFVTPQQRHCGQAVEICRHRAVVYEDASQRNPGDGHDRFAVGVSRRWSGSIHRQQKSNPRQLRWRWLPEQQQGRHLSWQSPVHEAKLLAYHHPVQYNTYRSHSTLKGRTPLEVIQQWKAA